MTQEAKQTKKVIKVSDLKKARAIFAYLIPYKWYLVLALVLLFISSLLTMVFPYLAGVMSDIATGTDHSFLNLREIGYLLIGILIFQGITSYTQVILNAIVSENAMADLRRSLYEKLISLPISFFEHNRVGELISRISNDVAKLQSVFAFTLLGFVRQFLILIAGVVLLLILVPRLSLIMLATFPFVVIGALFFGRFLRKTAKQRQQEVAATNVIVEETMHNIKTVKSYTNEKFEAKNYKEKIVALIKTSMRLARIRGAFSSFIVVLLFGGIFAMLWLGVLFVSENKMSIGDLVSFIAYTGFIGAAIASLGNYYSEIAAAIGATERIREILSTDSEHDIFSDATVEIEGNIQFDNVTFAYPTRKDTDVLKQMDMQIRAGQSVALVGQSGAGKSTIIQLIMKFYDVDSGSILIDGKKIEIFEHLALRKNMAIVPQEIILFGGTIRENILYGKPNATDEELLHAANMSNSLEFIDRFTEGFETIVGERGVKLSGGQKQRIAIARAILKDPKILILDEATSSLDTESERLVQEALDRLMLNRTTIVIAHRLSTIKNVDTIFVINDGKIVESGNHEELYTLENGTYASLAKLQYE